MSGHEGAVPVAAGGANVNADDPWPGLLAFRESDEGYFQGRQRETEDLLRLVLRERLIVLFGLSGLGKSSLLQAGLFPKLREKNVFPVYIRLDFSADRPELAGQVTATVAREANAHQIEAPPANHGETLWEYFHRDGNNFWNARNRPVKPLLVFDQFEEVFTLGHLDALRAAATEAFLRELADLVETRPPARLKERIDQHPEDAKAYDFARHHFKILLSIREDFLADLETLRVSMPTVALNRMRLQRMNGEAALLVVNQAQQLIDPEVGERVVRFVSADKADLPLTKLEVEPALLSVVCRELNNRRQTNREDKISAGLLQGNQEQVLADFYERSTADLPPEVRSYIEDHLLTVSGYRDSVALENALGTPGVSRKSIDSLVERRLVRREDRGGTQRLELTHDLLAGVARSSRDNRRQREAAELERAELLRIQAEQKRALLEAQEEQRLELEKVLRLEKTLEAAEAARDWQRSHIAKTRRRRRTRILWTVFGVLALIELGTFGYAVLAQQQAHRADLDAQESQRSMQRQMDMARSDFEEEKKNDAEKYAVLVGLISNQSKIDLQSAVESSSLACRLPRVYIRIVNEHDRDRAKQVAARLTANGILVLGIEYVPTSGGLQVTDVRYRTTSDEAEAKEISRVLQDSGEKPLLKWAPGQRVGSSECLNTVGTDNTFEVWLADGRGGVMH